jgi:hypothetical protein
MKKLIAVSLFVALLSVVSFGQTALPSTTLSAAITSSTTTITVASASGINSYPNNTELYIDREAVVVNSVSGTSLTVQRGASGTKAAAHVSGATVYVGANGGVYFANFGNFGACTASDFTYLPRPVVSITSPINGYLEDCFGGQKQFNMNLPLYTLTVAPQAQRSGTSPSAGNVVSLTAQAGGAQSGTTSGGGAGGASTLAGGAGGIGGSSSGTAGAGGAVSVTGGAGGAGPITGGAGGTITVKAGAGGNGSSAGGSGGTVDLVAGAVGTGGTGAAGKVRIKDAADNTKIAAFDVSGITTATTRTITVPDASITLGSTVTKSCGTTVTCAATTTNNVIMTFGSAALTSASPSTASITGLPFTSSSTFFCTASPEGSSAAVAAAGIAINKTSGSAMTLTGPNTVTTVIDYVCWGT